MSPPEPFGLAANDWAAVKATITAARRHAGNSERFMIPDLLRVGGGGAIRAKDPPDVRSTGETGGRIAQEPMAADGDLFYVTETPEPPGRTLVQTRVPSYSRPPA